MKNLKISLALCVCLAVNSLRASAQPPIPINEPDVNKPKMFEALPEKILLNIQEVAGLFTMDLGRPVSVALSNTVNFRLDGSIISNVSKYDNQIQSVVVRSTNLPGASFTISKITDNRGISYTGRLFSKQHNDLYELKYDNDQLYLVKRNYYDLVNE